MNGPQPPREGYLAARRPGALATRPQSGSSVEAILTGRVLAPGEQVTLSAEDVAMAWLLTYATSVNTHRSYRTAITEWFRFCAEAGVDPLVARRPLVELYKEWLYDSGRTPSTVKQRLAALGSFYNYAEDDEHVRRSPLRGVRRPKLSEQSKSTGLTREELNAFLAEAQRLGPQPHVLVMLLALNGLRASEPLLADVEDLGTERGHHTLAVVRKGSIDKVRVPLAPVTERAMSTWLEVRAQRLGQVGRGSGLLFYKIHRETREMAPFDRRDIYRMVQVIGAKAVPAKPSLHPHDLRHAFVTLSLDAGVPLRDVQDSAGHANPLTTRRYDRGRNNIDRHATYTLVTYLGGGGSE